MSNATSVHFFLGANSHLGFCSLCDHLIALSEADDIILLKGGPGSGKSPFLSQVAKALSDAGAAVEYLHSSRFPDLLDAVVFPELHCAIADGSLPHAEPTYPAAIERLLCLDEFYDIAPLKKRRDEIISLTLSYHTLVGRAARYFSAAKSVSDDIVSQVLTEDVAVRIAKRARGIAARELKHASGGSAKVTVRFLDGATSAGIRCRFDSVKTLCDRVYELVDNYGLSDGMLSILRDEALASGHDVIVCPSPWAPERLSHLIIPSLSLAFVTSTANLPYDGVPHRRIRLDAMPGSEQLRRHRTRLRFSKKISAALVEEGIRQLAQARTVFDELEAVYLPHVDLDAVGLLARQVGNQLLEKWKERE